MIVGTETHWSANDILRRSEAGSINYNHVVQRGLTWDSKRRSLLIASIVEGYPIPPIYVNKDGNTFYVLDGKQRCYAIMDYIKDKYLLSGLEDMSYTDISGKVQNININKKKFSDLPEDMQNTIKNKMIFVYVFDGLSDDEVSEMFFRLNNGKQLSSTEMNRVKAMSRKTIGELANHELFRTRLSKNAIQKYINEDLVIKTWGALYIENVSFNAAFIRPVLRDTEITDEQAKTINKVLDRIQNICNLIEMEGKQQGGAKQQEAKGVLSMLLKPSHFTPYVTVVNYSISNDVNISVLTDWTKKFFSDINKSEEYASLSRSGTGKAEIIKRRTDLLLSNYNKNVSQIKDKENKNDDKVVKKK